MRNLFLYTPSARPRPGRWLLLALLLALLGPLGAAAQVVTTLAGSGTAGAANGTGTAAQFRRPYGVAVDGSGNVYVADYGNSTIRKITAAGVVTTLAGTSGNLGSTNGTGAAASFNQPAGVAVDGSGTVYVADLSNNLIRKITAAGVVTTLAGSGAAGSANGTGTAASFSSPSGVAVDGSGTVYVADQVNQLIRQITAAGVVTTLAGSGTAGSANGTGTAASFNYPYGLAVDGSGTVYVAEQGGHRIRKITAAGVVTTLAGSGTAGSANGTGTAASFNNPTGVAVDGSGTVYVADFFNNLIRQITAAGVVTTLAGNVAGGSANGTGTAASFNVPIGVAAEGSGTVYVGDTFNNLIRKIAPLAPTLTGLSPTSGPVGTSVTLTGANFTSGATVSFNGTAAASVTFNSATSLTATVPTGASTGNVTVTTSGGTSSGVAFTVTATAPTVSGANPASGPRGTFVTVTGTNLTGATTVTIGPNMFTVNTTFTVVNATTITFTVPVTAFTSAGSITVYTPGGNASTPFTVTVVTAPTVTTAAASAITTSTATLGGNVTSDGGGTITERGVVYVAGNGTPTTSDTKITASGTTGAYTVSATGLTASTLYTVRAYATNSVGTSYGSSVSFTTSAALAASTSRTNVSCFGGSNGTATATATGGVSPYTYSWNTTPVQTTATATGLPAGTYTVTVTDAASQTTTATATITAPSALASSVSSQTNVACFGSSGSATVAVSGGTPGYSYNWAPSGGTAATATGLAAGTYTVTITDANACTKTQAVTITQPASALAVATSKTDATTNGGTDGTATATPSGGTPGYTYSWNTSPVQTTATATGLAAGTYTVTVTDANACTITGTATVGQPAALTLATGAVSGSPFCAGSVLSVSFTASTAPNASNVYTAQLSSASGSFAAPVTLGTLTSAAASGTISGTVPAGTAQGSGYRVRVVASAPATTGTDNGSNLTVTNTPAPTGSASQSFGSGATVANLVATGTAVQWYAASSGGTALAGSTALVNGSTYYATQTVSGCESLPRLAVTVTITAPANLTISTGSTAAPVSIAAGTYNNVSITGSGYGQLAGGVVVTGTMSVLGSLDTNCQTLTGAGSFTLSAGSTLYICDDNGISATGSTGAVQTATRSFSPDASYVYNGNGAVQSTGTGLPAQVRSLTAANDNNDVRLTQAVRVAQVLAVTGKGNLLTNGQALTLLSDATGTALAVNSSGGGVVSGNATVQRYIDGSLNPGAGYRHFSAPVSNTTVADLATLTGFTPEVSQASTYNSSATPGTTTPFPTVFGYDQARLATATNNLSAFDKGFFVPAGLGTALPPGQGYAVNLSASQLVDFVGTLGTGNRTLPLARNSGPTAADAGWQLVGNPYPAPLDWSLVAPADRAGLDGSMYVVQSTGQYAGGYRSYVNGQSTTGTNNPLIASSQGFWVRVSAGNTAGSLTFRNAQRVTDYATQQVFQRGTADLRPALRLALAGNGGADAWVAYAETGATAAFDAQYDAAKLANSTGLNLSSEAGSDELAIDGQAAFTAATVLPLAVGVPAAGSYTLALAEARNLPAGLTAYLRDAQTGSLTALAAGTSYAFSIANAQALVRGRFSVVFRSSALAATPAALAAQVSVYPNPAHDHTTVAVPGLAGASQVQVQVLNALGQVMLRQQAALPASGTSLTLPTGQLASGVYVVRLTLGQTTLTKRLTVE